MDEDDDIYAGSGGLPGMSGDDGSYQQQQGHIKQERAHGGGDDEMDEDDEDDDEDSDDDGIQIITTRKPGETPAEPLTHATRASSAIKIEAPGTSSTPQPPGSSSAAAAAVHLSSTLPSSATPVGPGAPPPSSSTPLGRVASPAAGRPGSSYPEVKTSTLDLEGNPVLAATGRPIFSTDMDEDFGAGGADTAPWRKPGTDMSDYYNYGFDEGSWAAYCIKQRQIRGEMAEDKKMMEKLNAFMGGQFGFPMPGMGGAAGAGAGGAGVGGGAGVPGDPMAGVGGQAGQPDMSGMTPDQMQFMASMMSGGMPGMPNMGGASMGGASMGGGNMGGNMGGGMPSGPQQGGYGNQGYGGGRNQGGRGKRW